jgi:hypothetical protein
VDSSPSGRFPAKEVRDLLGVVRAIYAAAVDRGAGRFELEKIAQIGRDLGLALAMAEGETAPGARETLPAWQLAERATKEAFFIARITDGADVVVKAACARVLRETEGGAVMIRPRRRGKDTGR